MAHALQCQSSCKTSFTYPYSTHQLVLDEIEIFSKALLLSEFNKSTGSYNDVLSKLLLSDLSEGGWKLKKESTIGTPADLAGQKIRL